jgi:hypothetical protein
MPYSNKDARFDAIQLGACPRCYRWKCTCHEKYCEDCGCPLDNGTCPECDPGAFDECEFCGAPMIHEHCCSGMEGQKYQEACERGKLDV